ncbi:Hypothetical protein SMAX5B_017248 [Scophthalmus maximus]|uniref:Uncharacterized protein n=1 Tax=Scophthalmus maximus TaxID=52904 RepID=A0A2U9CMN3_SCOMX|nr:Hypothetical protein SMAX5B_017248 [Scophthalmus maximus]
MNEQPPGSRDQPTSSTANQPLAVFQSKCIHCAHFTPLCVDGELLQTEASVLWHLPHNDVTVYRTEVGSVLRLMHSGTE